MRESDGGLVVGVGAGWLQKEALWRLGTGEQKWMVAQPLRRDKAKEAGIEEDE